MGRKTTVVNCKACGIEFDAVVSEIKRGNGKFCSRYCQRSYQARLNAEAMKTGITRKELSERWSQSADPMIKKTHHTVEQEIKSGRLTRQKCEVCGTEENVDAHHDDYSKPLEIHWLCRTHHLKHHRSR